MEKGSELKDASLDIIFHHISDLIFQIKVIDVHHYEIEAVNEAYLSSYETSKEAISGRRIEDFLGVDQGIQAIRRFQEAIIRKKTIQFEEGYSFPKQGYKIFDITLVPLIEKGTVERLVGVAKDITEKRLNEEHLAQSEKLSIVGQLAAGIAHELRNPLTSLKGFLKLIQFRNTDQDIDRYVQVMDSEFHRIEQIIDEFLILAKPTKSHFQNNHIQHILDEVIELLSGQANMKSIILKKEYPSFLPPIYSECNQLKQVFINLIKNAMDAIGEEGEITIKAKELTQHLQIQVIDNGGGITDEELEKLGSPFFTTKKNGTGLGLTICKRIVKKHKGTFTVESNEGKGTTITLNFPKSV